MLCYVDQFTSFLLLLLILIIRIDLDMLKHKSVPFVVTQQCNRLRRFCGRASFVEI